jgi:hypothetical protein
LLPEKARTQIIEILGRTIESFKLDEKRWVEEDRAKGNDPDNEIRVMVVRMLLSLQGGWLEAEKELLDLESQFRKFVPVNEKRIVRKKK